ncbi:MAG: hypothetical protein OQK04_18135, partial [Kangiellaceae bacterium]|nr:hypothetical protein [Kangiellaceae bacterium]
LASAQLIKQATGTVTISEGTHESVLIFTAGTPDAQNRQQRFFYDDQGRQVGVLDGEGYFTRSIYNSLGQLIHTISYANPVTDPNATDINGLGITLDVDNDQEIEYFYNNQGALIGIVDAEGYLTERQYDVAGRLEFEIRYNEKARIENGETLEDIRPTDINDVQSLSFTYDALGRVATESNHLGLTKSYTYDQLGNVTRVDYVAADIQDRRIHNTYDELGRLTGSLDAEQSDPLGITPLADAISTAIENTGTRYQYDALGLQISSIDPNGLKTLYFYDQERQLRFVINANGEVRETRYNQFGEVSENLAYNKRLNQLTTTDFNVFLGNDVDSLADLAGGLTSSGLLGLMGYLSSDGTQTSQVEYNQRGLIERTIDAEGYRTDYSYNSFAEQILRTDYLDKLNTQSSITQFEYNNRGLLKSTTDALSNTTRNEYDAFGRLISFTDALGHTTKYGYDKNDRQILITDPRGGQLHTAYDAFNRTLLITDKLGNRNTYQYDLDTKTNTIIFADNSTSRTVYNSLGETVESYDGFNSKTEFTFNLNGELTHVTDAAGNVSESQFDEGGRLATTIDQNGIRTTYDYDAAGRVLTQIQDVDGLNRTTSYQYDGAGRQIEYTDPEGRVKTFEYDASGQLINSIVDPDGLAIKTHYEYDEVGNKVLEQVIDASGVKRMVK